MAFVGMDPERVRRIAEQLRQSGVRVATIGEDIQRLIDQSVGGWEGMDYQDFTSGWSGQHRLTLETAATGIETMALSVIEDIAEQEIASGITPGGPGSVLPPGSVIPGTSTPVAGLTPEKLAEMSPEDRAKALEAMSPEERAKLLALMSPEDQAEALEAMSPAATAATLAAMSPAVRAAAIGAMSTDKAKAALAEMSRADLEATYDAMEPELLAELIGDGVVVDSITGTVEGSAEAGSWKIEGKAEAAYKVEADGSVTMSVQLEGGLGKSIDAAGAEGSVTAGLTGAYELQFDSVEDAEKFLKDLGNAVTDVGLDDVTDISGTIADNVENVFDSVEDQSVKFGGYIKGEVEGEIGDLVTGAGEARVDYTYDPTKNEHALKFEAQASVEAGVDGGEKVTAQGKISVEAKLEGTTPTELKLSMSASGTFAAEQLGIGSTNPTSSASLGAGGEMTMSINPSDPGFQEVYEAVKSGDMDRATSLALENSTLTYREYTVEKIAEGGNDFEASVLGKKLAGAEYSYSITGESATNVWVKPPGTGKAYDITEGIR
jgi:hypothetical protein